MRLSDYDFIVVGAGPAGIFFAYEMGQRNPNKSVLLIERGFPIQKRYCPEAEKGKCMKCQPCRKTNGFSGSGGFSDGKLSLFNPEDEDFHVGGNLHKYIGVEECKKVICYTDNVYLHFGATKALEGVGHHAEVARLRKLGERSGLELINIPIRHLGTEKAHDLYERMQNYLLDIGVEIAFETEVEDLIIEDNQVRGVLLTGGSKIWAHEAVVVAVGRVGANWLLNMCQQHAIKTAPGIVDIGVRYELPNEVMNDVNKLLYEGKFVGKPEPFGDKVRTFCQNPGGFVASEVYDGGITLVNGHALKNKKSELTNLALLVSLTFPGMKNPMEYARNIARNLNALTGGEVMVQRFGDVLEGKRTWPEELGAIDPTLKSAIPGDLSLGMPHRVLMNIVGFIKKMDEVVPRFADKENLMYGPEIKFYSNKLELSNDFETSVKSLYAIGDGCGLTRGLMMASASGIQLARVLSKA